jgi:hypothetical protein
VAGGSGNLGASVKLPWQPPSPTLRQLKTAARLFPEREPRDLFYRVALELIRLAGQRETKITVGEALAVLLQTWNLNVYRFHPEKAPQLAAQLDELLRTQKSSLASFRRRSIESLTPQDYDAIRELFDAFDAVAGPVGTAKALHLLAPRFFPLWDAAIRRAYRVAGGRAGTRSRQYLRFLEITQAQAQALSGRNGIGNPLKALDEFNYGRYTKQWPELVQ